MTTRRYRLKLATWTVVREPGAPSPRTLSSPTAVAELARDLLRDQDDDKEHVTRSMYGPPPIRKPAVEQ